MTIRVTVPRPGMEALEPLTPPQPGPRRTFSREFLRWLRELAQSLGWADQVPIKRSLWVGGSSMEVTVGTSTPVLIQGAVRMPGLPDAATTTRQAAALLEEDYKPGTDLNFFVDLCSTVTSGLNVLIGLAVSYANPGEQHAIRTFISQAVEVPKVDNTRFTVSFGPLSVDGMDRGADLLMAVTRLGLSGSDTHTGTVALLGVGCNKRVEGIGRVDPAV